MREQVWSPAIASCPGGQDTVAGEKDVVVEVVMVDEVVELVVDGASLAQGHANFLF